MQSLGLLKLKSEGTEGKCYQVKCRRTKRIMALKKARVYPDNEGVPYYMMRELSALKVNYNISYSILYSIIHSAVLSYAVPGRN